MEKRRTLHCIGRCFSFIPFETDRWWIESSVCDSLPSNWPFWSSWLLLPHIKLGCKYIRGRRTHTHTQKQWRSCKEPEKNQKRWWTIFYFLPPPIFVFSFGFGRDEINTEWCVWWRITIERATVCVNKRKAVVVAVVAVRNACCMSTMCNIPMNLWCLLQLSLNCSRNCSTPKLEPKSFPMPSKSST